MPHNSRGQRAATNKSKNLSKQSAYAKALRPNTGSQKGKKSSTGTGTIGGGSSA